MRLFVERCEQVDVVAVGVAEAWRSAAPKTHPKGETAGRAGGDGCRVRGVHVGRRVAQERESDAGPSSWRLPVGVQRSNDVDVIDGDAKPFRQRRLDVGLRLRVVGKRHPEAPVENLNEGAMSATTIPIMSSDGCHGLIRGRTPPAL